MARKLVNKAQRIIELQASNVKRLRAIEIIPKEGEPLVVVGGRNRQGKSSTLDSIMFALTGGKNIPKGAIHDGEERAEITIKTDDLEITRVITPSGAQLELRPRNLDGIKIQRPQQVLNGLIGHLSFDPYKFIGLDSKKQGEELRQIVGIDFSDLDQELRDSREERTHLNRDLKKAQAILEELPYFPDAGDEEVSVGELTEEYRGILAQNNEIERLSDETKRKEERTTKINAEIDLINSEIENLKRRIVDLKNEREEVSQEMVQISKILSEKKLQDVSGIEAKIAGVDNHNSKVRANAQYLEQQAQVEKLNRTSKDLSDRIEEIEKERRGRIAAAKMPVEGLAFDEDGNVTFSGRPLELCSSAEKLRVSVAIAMAGRPDMRIILVRDGSSLDSESLQQLGECARQYDAQVWVEKVMEDDNGATVIIEDGMVKASVGTEPLGANKGGGEDGDKATG